METPEKQSDIGELIARPGQVFPTTHWSAVTAAGGADSPQSAAALAELCGGYWVPVYAYIRRQGHDQPTAQDLTQAFFARLIERNFIAGAAQEKGRFRSFLLIALKRFLVNQWEHGQAQKRGGDRTIIALDAAEAEERYRLEPVDTMTADRIFDRRWALAVLDGVMNSLRADFVTQGNGELFDHLRGFLSGEGGELSQAEIGARCGLSESAVKAAVHRLRERYRERLREHVAQTVARRTDVEDELRQLLEALRG